MRDRHREPLPLGSFNDFDNVARDLRDVGGGRGGVFAPAVVAPVFAVIRVKDLTTAGEQEHLAAARRAVVQLRTDQPQVVARARQAWCRDESADCGCAVH